MDLNKRVIVFVKKDSLKVINTPNLLHVCNSSSGIVEFDIRMKPKFRFDIDYDGGYFDGVLSDTFITYRVYIQGWVVNKFLKKVNCVRKSIDHGLDNLLGDNPVDIESLREDLKQILESLREGIEREQLVFKEDEKVALNRCFKILETLSLPPN